ncbi:FecR family protein [Dyadobacter fermentans]|uniref:Anti-FecI sigma factor, FecR n=1 Tax=Dyadobacter fermentans (strain ATCC 700827 / DSM 18053 / CIP 107007 / KCTC 52180 / NS114) TaxID=471854 RepID=C6W4S1_DYAFD|nr:FecR family protein [Dyadobacter fermentans]ACT95895.1 anti-FecI sigma factor, FecR [Dyadobacter fermentans DSM 18053]
MKHDPYSLTELIRNEEFIAWVMHPDELSDRKWRAFLDKHPGKRKTVESAREYVILLAKDTGRHQPTQKQSDRMWSIVESHMHNETPQTAEQEPVFKTTRGHGWRWARVAASAALILSIGSVSYWFYYKKADGPLQEAAVREEINSADIIQKYNDTDKPMTVLLQDGSSVVLQPGGRLSYSEGANRKRREVTLTGRAFFEIVKNKQKPFLVYSYGLATKVLGTSFTIDASSENKDIKVEVRTGTVSVFSINNLDNSQKEAALDKPELEGVTLNHDQRIAFSKESGKIIPLPAAVAASSDKDVSKQQFVFDETPVSEVFRILESAYNVRIVYDREKLGGCPLNATLIGQPFKEKLEVICNALDAQYELADNRITILGKGCK